MHGSMLIVMMRYCPQHVSTETHEMHRPTSHEEEVKNDEAIAKPVAYNSHADQPLLLRFSSIPYNLIEHRVPGLKSQ